MKKWTLTNIDGDGTEVKQYFDTREEAEREAEWTFGRLEFLEVEDEEQEKKLCKVIAVANQKGGVGKTTTTLNMGAGLMLKGKRVLMVDFDQQANLTLNCGVRDFDDLKESIATAMEAVIDDETEVMPQIFEYRNSGGIARVDFIPSNIEMAKINLELVQVMAREFVLKKLLEPLKDRYEYILIDCAPSLSVDLINALVAADEVLIVMTPGKFSTSGTEQLIKSINKTKRNLNANLEIAGVLFNRVDRRNNFTKDIIESMRSTWGQDIRIFDTEIPNSIRIDESQSMGEYIAEYEPNNKVAMAYEAFVEEYLRR